jgi:hypothetical protein
MKYLKSYMIFESKEDSIKSDITDMSFDIIDLGYKVDIEFDNEFLDLGTLKLVIRIYTEDSIRRESRRRGHFFSDWFTFDSDIKDFVLRVYQYMRELGWYSNLSINSGIKDLKKKFYIRPDERMRTEDIIEIEENHPRVRDIEMIFIKSI